MEQKKEVLFEKLRRYIGNGTLKVQGNERQVSIICQDKNEILVRALSADEKTRLLRHRDHNITCACYGKKDFIFNVSIECMDCYEVLFDLDNPEI